MFTDIDSSRKSQRILEKYIIPTLELGNNGHSISSKKIQKFVNREINYGPQIISLPVSPERHAFLADIMEDKIMISDISGKKNKIKGIKFLNNNKNNNYEIRWENYSNLIKFIEEKYKLQTKYYIIDKVLLKESMKHHKTFNNSGGCSYYIYEWIKKNYPFYST
jgi:hypothetical protein